MLVLCTKCSTALPARLIKLQDQASCPSCNSDLMIRSFPALLKERDDHQSGVRSEEGEATCFQHLSKRAEAECSQCGRFLCGLCSIEFGGKTWCPACIAGATEKRNDVRLENKRVLYDSIALSLATLPILLYPVMALTAPAAIYVSLRYWRRPGSMVRRSKWRFVVAILLALVELVLIALIIVGLVIAVRGTRR